MIEIYKRTSGILHMHADLLMTGEVKPILTCRKIDKGGSMDHVTKLFVYIRGMFRSLSTTRSMTSERKERT